MSAALLVASDCELGEGIVWRDRRQALLWTDIQRAALWGFHPESGAVHRWRLPDRLGSLALCESGRLLLAFSKQLCIADLDWAQDEPMISSLCAFETQHAGLRSNDGRADRRGNFVFGTLNEGADREPAGSFYQFSMRHGLRRLDLGGVTIPNSICFSPDGRVLYYCDSMLGQIMCCDYDPDSASVGDVRVFARVAGPGGPDGSAIDASGRLWNAEWGAARVVHYSAQDEVDLAIQVPALQASCLCFGGPDFDRIFISSARENLAQTELETWPLSGSVFCVDGVGARGLPESRFNDNASTRAN